MSNKIFFSFFLIFFLGINPHVIEEVGKGCSHGCSREASSAERAATQEAAERAAAQEAAERAAAHEADRTATQKGSWIQPKEKETQTDGQRVFETHENNSERTYSYNNKEYANFQDIPFQSSDKLYFDHKLTPQEAQHLMERDVKFVYNNQSFLQQKDKAFKILYLISDDIESVKALYELDQSHAEELVEWSSMLSNASVIKVSSYAEMLSKQNEVLNNDEIPILIFHNNVKQTTLNSFDSRSNFITCNSFTVNPESFLTSTNLIDMRAVIDGINASYSQTSLENFYNQFTNTYYSYMKEKHQTTTLLYLGGGLLVTGGVVAIAYYNN